MSLTTQEFLNKLQRVKLNLRSDDKPLKLASYSSLAKQSVRIFTDGKNSSGTLIGNYSTEDIWINPNPPSGDFIPRNNGGFSPLTGKTGKTEFASGKRKGQPHKTSYFKGWKGLRDAQGLPTSHVDLNFTGELFSDFCNPQGGIPTTRKVNNQEFITSLRKELSQNKLSGAELLFKCEIGRLTKEERAEFLKVLQFEMRKLIAES